jgi:membrane associated rhomboid family serine protease
VGFLILLVVLGAVAYRITSPQERARYVDIARDVLEQLKAVARRPRPEVDAFRVVLQTRMRHVIVTATIAVINLLVFGGLLFGAGAMSDPGTIIGWGASLGPRTTNGEWWRLLTSMFVHAGILHVLLSVAILWQLGRILERLAGRIAFAAVYLTTGVFAGLVNLAFRPVAITAGSQGALYGLYGLLLATLICQLHLHRRQHSEPDPEPDGGAEVEPIAEPAVRIPLIEMNRLAVGATVFGLYTLLSGLLSLAELAALIVGLLYGLVLAPGTAERQPGTRRAAIAAAVASLIAAAYALPLRNIADVKPEIARVIAAEQRTTTNYQAALEAFKKGRLAADALAKLAEREIVPELQAVDARLEALKNVPAEHQALVTDAREFLRLRVESWRLRADAVRRTSTVPHRASGDAQDASWRVQAEARFRSNMTATGKAEGAERASMAAFQRVRSTAPATTP